MFITHVDSGLEKLLRTHVPLAESVGDVSFDVPTKEWAAQLGRITVNLFLYDVSRSTQPTRTEASRPGPDGSGLRRRGQPMIQLTYLISVWAGGVRDEHLLLGEVTSVLAGAGAIPPDLLSGELASSVQLVLGDERVAAHQVWTATGGTLRPSLALRAVVAADTFDWEPEPRRVEAITAMAERMPHRR